MKFVTNQLKKGFNWVIPTKQSTLYSQHITSVLASSLLSFFRILTPYMLRHPNSDFDSTKLENASILISISISNPESELSHH